MKRVLVISIVIVILVSTAGCNLPTEAAPPAEVLPTQAGVEVVPPPTKAPMDAPPPPSPPTAEPEIVHVNIPAQGNEKEQTIHDQVSQETAPQKRAYGGDEYPNGRYERPFTAEEMEYLPFIDIVRTDLIRDEDGGWLYADIVVVEPPSKSGERKAIYGIEVDNDLDGRGDVLILADAPESTEWTTDGVRVWQDLNANLGAAKPMQPDAPVQDDGYELLIFDEGVGDDADLAWVRLSPDEPNRIDIAFKLDLVDIGEEYYFFLWGAWAFVDDAHPDWFDHHDRFTLEEMGSPLKDNDHYPLNAFAAADNTCRALSGLAPTGPLPGMCPIPRTAPQADEPPGGGCVPIDCCAHQPLTHVCILVWDPDQCRCVGN
ncbi:MAG: hypothetical protein RBT34_12705 [Anaerolineaceae bacterium]|nr:hypothetical protein [Anaerolineaceae bacterium]